MKKEEIKGKDKNGMKVALIVSVLKKAKSKGKDKEKEEKCEECGKEPCECEE